VIMDHYKKGYLPHSVLLLERSDEVLQWMLVVHFLPFCQHGILVAKTSFKNHLQSTWTIRNLRSCY